MILFTMQIEREGKFSPKKQRCFQTASPDKSKTVRISRSCACECCRLPLSKFMKEIDFGDIRPYSNFCPLVPTVTASLLFLTLVTFLQSWLSLAIISVVTSFSVPETFLRQAFLKTQK